MIRPIPVTWRWRIWVKLGCAKYTKSLTHWGRVMPICVSKLSITGSNNCVSPGRRQAIIWTNAETLLIRTNFSEILSEIHTFSFGKMHLKMASAKWRQLCLGLNVVRIWLVVLPAFTKNFFYKSQQNNVSSARNFKWRKVTMIKIEPHRHCRGRIMRRRCSSPDLWGSAKNTCLMSSG